MTGQLLARHTRRHPVTTFFLLAFTISWLGYVPLLLRSQGCSGFRSSLWFACLALPGIGPAAAALIVTTTENTFAFALRHLLHSFAKPTSGAWLLVSVLLPLGLSLASGMPGHPPSLQPRPPLTGLLLYAVLSIAANPCEEFGWRGFALARLQAHHSGLISATVVGLLWALWHIPLFLLRDGPMSMAHIPFTIWAVGLLGQSVLLAWIFNSTARSLQAVTLFHVSGNIFGVIVGAPPGLWSSVFRLLAAAIVLAVCGVRLNAPAPPRPQEV